MHVPAGVEGPERAALLACIERARFHMHCPGRRRRGRNIRNKRERGLQIVCETRIWVWHRLTLKRCFADPVVAGAMVACMWLCVPLCLPIALHALHARRCLHSAAHALWLRLALKRAARRRCVARSLRYVSRLRPVGNLRTGRGRGIGRRPQGGPATVRWLSDSTRRFRNVMEERGRVRDDERCGAHAEGCVCEAIAN
eukprot:6214386-Pleurochrysis_carterae.AAC.2